MKKIFLIIVFIIGCSCNYEVEVTYLPSKVVFIDPGHGGKDNGCVFYNVYEDDINLSISTYLFELLLKNNYITYITRSDDYDLADLYANNRKNEDLKRRVKYINNSHSDIFISIHLNYYRIESVNGPMVYYQKNNACSKILANCIQNRFNEYLYLNKIIHYGDYYLLNKTKVTGVIVECGFLSNLKERNNLIDSSYQYNIASIIFDAINDYFIKISTLE